MRCDGLFTGYLRRVNGGSMTGWEMTGVWDDSLLQDAKYVCPCLGYRIYGGVVKAKG